MGKLLLIGIDSLAPALLSQYEKSLPHFTQLRQQSPDIKLTSVFPVDSIPAWVSIFTGWNPARHGIVYTFDIFDTNLFEIESIDINIFKGKTFWDHASSLGKKVCVLFPLLAFPPWPINGIMVSVATPQRGVKGEPEWIVERELQTYPPWVAEKYHLPRFKREVFGKHPGVKNLGKFAEDAKKVLIEEAELGFRLSQDHEWELFFIYFSWLDIIQHRLWRYSDENDPSYTGVTPYKDIIKECYQLLDQIVGEFMALHPDTTTIVFSDHGHGIRPAKTVNINGVLKERGLLVPKNSLGPLPYVMEKLTQKMLDFIRRFELDYWLVKLSTKTKALSALSKGVYTSIPSLDMTRTVAYLSAFAGVKAYPHGGIEIKRDNLRGRDYEQLRELIVKELLELKAPGTGGRLVKWACQREELYQGPRVSQAYPDVVFELRDGYGTHWSIYPPLIGTAYEHNLAPGGHHKDAVFLLSGLPNRKSLRQSMTLMDVAPTILDILGVKKDLDFDGASIFSPSSKGG